MEILGIDVGGSGIKGALVNVETGQLAGGRRRLKTPQPATPKGVIATVGKLVRKFDYQGPLGVGFPAIVLDGVVMSAANVSPKWVGYPGATAMAEATGCPVTLLNDADVAGLAEARFGAGRDQKGVIVVLTIGTGIGSALFVDGRLVPNTELGHLYLPGHREDAEEYASDRIRTEKKLKWPEWAGRLDKYLRHIEFLFSPNLFILGGGVSRKHEKFIPLLTVRAPVVPAALRNEAGIVGAALAAAPL
ncbi:MAG: ROK family protein [Chloroflexi bacterium]|nr:ROK family protein [Chloroflexota bacterium]MCI0580436.1 ROK family protein [Chloroflexota bacterium]MCI0643931.1 ROK family protein [Chloroflexota bacterium]MCI0729159.1 ROK family protein [Chloroflexota bacterium]